MIFIDPSEARENSLLSKTTIDASTSLTGLEEHTGADMLISVLDLPRVTAIGTTASRVALEQHCRHGILIQRKSGTDLLNSIPDLANIISKMLQWESAAPPWLLVTGNFIATREGYVSAGGHDTQWAYSAFIGALEAWQLRGGGITILTRDSLISQWVTNWYNKIGSVSKDKLILPRKPTQLVVSLGGDKQPWRMTIATFPGIGHELATRIAQYCGTLKDALVFLSDPRHHSLRKSDRYPKGMGPSKFADAREWLGLESTDDNQLEILVSTFDNEHVYKSSNNSPPFELD